mmetsp:Transcript_1994/g.4981  ORF Transcript_1994/g.4981 Transcript_1994/m.4981 type:complete len:91 (-) Transcript_1994:346-618(-)
MYAQGWVDEYAQFAIDLAAELLVTLGGALDGGHMLAGVHPEHVVILSRAMRSTGDLLPRPCYHRRLPSALPKNAQQTTTPPRWSLLTPPR